MPRYCFLRLPMCKRSSPEDASREESVSESDDISDSDSSTRRSGNPSRNSTTNTTSNRKGGKGSKYVLESMGKKTGQQGSTNQTRQRAVESSADEQSKRRPAPEETPTQTASTMAESGSLQKQKTLTSPEDTGTKQDAPAPAIQVSKARGHEDDAIRNRNKAVKTRHASGDSTSTEMDGGFV